MSRTVDQRVVEMQFDNGQFERNVKTSMNTLDRLKQSLNMNGATKGLENVQQASNNIDFSRMAAGVESLQNRFSTLGIVGMRVIENLTDSAMRFANKTLSFITNGIVQGGIRRAMNLENAHFQLQGLLKDEAQVSAIMKNVNDSVDGTAYSLDAAAKVASQLAASGMRAGDEMFTSLRAVAGVAAMTNSDYESIGEIFTTVAGNGRLMGEQLLQLSSRGMNAAATLAEYLGTSEAKVRDMVSKGKIDFKTFAAAMDDAFGEHAKKANETFTGSLSNIKAALARIGALFVSPLIVQNGPIVKLFNTLRERFNDIKSTIGPLADQFTGSVNKMAESATAFLSRMKSEDRIQILSNIVSTLTNVFSGLWSILKPVGQAFKDIFPAATANSLINFTNKLKDLTAKIKLGDTESKNLRDTFKGIFSVLKLVVNAVTTVAKGAGNLISKLTGIRGGLLGITSAIGNWLTKVTGAVEKTGAFKAVVGGLSDYLGRCLESIKKFIGALNEKLIAPGFHGLVDLLKKLWGLVEKIGSKISEFFKGIGESFNGNSLNGAFTLMGMLILLKVAYRKFFDDWIPVIKRWKSLIQDGFLKTLESVVKAPEGIISAFNAVKRSIWTFNKSIKYDNIMKLAKALLVLAAAMLVISLIDTDKMAASFTILTALVAELMGVLQLYDAFGSKKISDSAGIVSASISMIGMAIAVTILASAMKKLSGLDADHMIQNLFGITVLIGILVSAAKIMNEEEREMLKFGKQMLIMSAAVLILASACKKLGGLSWGDLIKGVGGVLALTMTFVAAAKILSKDEKAINKFAGQMLLMSFGIAIMAKVCQSLSGLSWGELAKGGVGLLAATAMLVAAAKIMSKDSKHVLKGAFQMVLLAAAISIMGRTLSNLSGLSWEGIAKGLVAMGGAVAILAIGLKAMDGTFKGSAALLVAATSLAIIAPVLTTLGGMSWTSIAKGLITIAGAFTIIGLAGLIMEPVIGAIIKVAAAIALMGIGCMAAGVGLQFFASGLAMLATVTVTAAMSIVSALKVILLGILGMIPELASSLVTAFKSLIGVFVECIPALSAGILKLIIGVFESLVQYTPQIVELVFNFLIGVFEGIAKNMPRLVKSIVDMFASIFSSVIDALSQVSPDVLLKGVACVGMLILIAHGMASLVAITPMALLGVAAFGLIVGELAAVLAALGALAKKPEIQALISSGGNLLQNIGTAIGQFVGGIAGGIAKGFTSALPEVGTNLSTFMTNLQPFLDGAKSINASTFDGVMSLVKVMTAITGANILECISQFITGSSSMTTFANQLIPFGKAITEFSRTVSGNIDEGAITAAANAGKVISEMADTIPNTGGLVSLFAGDNDLATFAEDLIPFGKAIAEFSNTVAGNIDEGAITAAANAGKVLTEMANTIPNTGGLISFFAGDNDLATFAEDLIPFGAAMALFSNTVKNIDEGAVVGAANAGKALAEMANTVPNTGGLISLFSGDNSLTSFALQLVPFGAAMVLFSNTVKNVDEGAVVGAANAGKALAEMANTIPNTGGLVTFFTGDNNLVQFAYSLIPFGEAMAQFSATVSGNIDEGSITAAANAGKVLAEMQATLPKTGGVVRWFSGEQQNMATLGLQLVAFGTSMVAFSKTVSGNIDEGAITAAANAGKALAEMQATLPNTGGVVQWFSGNKESLTTFGEGIEQFGSAMCGFSKALTAEGSGFSADTVVAAANAGKALAEMQATLPNTGGVVQWFAGNKESLPIFAEGIEKFGSAMCGFSQALTSEGGFSADAVTAAANAGKALAEMQATLPETGGVVQWFSGNKESLESFGEGIKSFGSAMCGFSQTLTAEGSGFSADAVVAAANAGKVVAEMAASIPNSVSNLGVLTNKLEPFGTALGTFQSKISEINLELLSTAVTKIEEIVEKLSKVSSNGLDKFVDSFAEAETKAASAATKMLYSTISKIESKESKFKSAGKKLTDNLIKGLKENKKDIPKAVTGSLDDAVSGIKESYNDFYNAGSYLVEGFASGISANTWKAEAKSKAMAEAAEKAAKEALDINSPSKVFRRVGYSVPEGFAQGIDRMGGMVKVASVAMANRAFDSTKGALSKLGRLFDGEIDTQPVIRPVVDLSDVASSVGTMNSMLNTTPSIGVLSNVSAISSMMNNRQNGGNEDVISAIHDLGKQISRSSGDSYSINGITYDDGSNVSDAVRTLVRAARIERRT